MAKKVLIVDDAIFMRNMIRDIFSGGGFEVVGEAANGLEAVEKYR
jgi:two-component system chemotaxis response regulator CheY